MSKNIFFSIVISLFFSFKNFVFSQNKFIKEDNKRKIIELKKELEITDDQEIQIINILNNTKYSNNEAKKIDLAAKDNRRELKKEKKIEKKRIKEENRMAEEEDEEEDSKITENKEVKKEETKKEILVYREDQRAKIERVLLPDQKIIFRYLIQRKVDSIKLYKKQGNQK